MNMELFFRVCLPGVALAALPESRLSPKAKRKLRVALPLTLKPGNLKPPLNRSAAPLDRR